ncbi:MAG: manganese-binding transcriptional regulator MntR [Rhodospirillaceae bacterium]|nr:manganese-binding transcriptional regulator MntR [Rhodospirillaceae bacterium]
MFARLREAHATEVLEDYVEMIADLIDGEGEARAVDLSERFGVTAATVNSTVKRLERNGYVTSKPYRAIFLTDKGRELAGRCRERHRLVFTFLLALGVEHDVAAADAEGMEHHVSEETLAAFEHYLKTVSRS